jgi:hypothetical protein
MNHQNDIQIESTQIVQAVNPEYPMQERYCGMVNDENTLTADIVIKEVVQKALHESDSSRGLILFIP